MLIVENGGLRGGPQLLPFWLQSRSSDSDISYVTKSNLLNSIRHFKTAAVAIAVGWAAFASQAAAISGEIALKESDSRGGFIKNFGTTLKATTSWRVADFFGKQTVYAGITVKNLGPKPVAFEYSVAFYDKDRRLVGAASQGSFGESGLKAGGELQLGSCLIKLPPNKYKEIKYYEAVLYEMPPQPKVASKR
jgi:hypothetical protein